MDDPAAMCERAASIVTEDPEEAYRLFEAAAAMGSANAKFGAAELKMAGSGTPLDAAGAEALYEEAAEAGHPPSMYRLGILWSGEGGHAEDAAKSAAWILRSAEAGFPPAYRDAAEVLLGGYGVEEDPAAALDMYRRAAAHGDPAAMFRAGYMLAEGVGTARDAEAAEPLFRASAELGVPEAMLQMSRLRLDAGDAEGALAWCRRAAGTGFVPAVYRLATMLYQGEGAPRDLEAAFRLYRGLSEGGEADATFMVGRMMIDGLGVEKDPEGGMEVVAKAAAMGSAMALQLVEDRRRRQNTQFVRIDGSRSLHGDELVLGLPAHGADPVVGEVRERDVLLVVVVDVPADGAAVLHGGASVSQVFGGAPGGA